MPNFEHVGHYKTGAFPFYKKGPNLYRVTFDQSNDIYIVPEVEYPDFVDWVCLGWSGDDIQGDDESNAEFLERRDVQIFEV